VLVEGVCRFLVAYDIAQAIDLERCAALIHGASRVGTLQLVHHAPSYFQFHTPPLRFTQDIAPVAVGRWATSPHLDVTLFEFGAVSLSYTIELRADLDEWIRLSCALADEPALEADALRRVEGLLATISQHVTSGSLAQQVEDYVVFRFPEHLAAGDAPAFATANAADLARLLRAEPGQLSRQEVDDALAARVSFQPGDLVAVDWNGAVLIDDDPMDVMRVIEFANVQLLELRYLDGKLDRALDRAHELLQRRDWRRRLGLAPLRRDLDRVSTMQVDGAILFERVGNALKLLSDQYLARVLRQANQRFRVAEWNAGILRKLETLEDIYGKINDHAATLRAEFLELTIVLLIAFEIALSLLHR
jgi:hypothetical protein